MAEAVIRVNVEGSWRELQPFWSLGVDATDHGPDVATFVCKQRLPKFTEVEVLIDGLTVMDGWVEENPTADGLTTVTAWGWVRHLDDDPYQYAYFVSGFGRATDARAGANVNQAYWARAGMNISDKALVMGLEPGHIFYQYQGSGATWDLGPGGMGARTVWLHQTFCNVASKNNITLAARVHATREAHHPPVTSLVTYSDPVAFNAVNGGAMWYGPFTFAASSMRYLSVFMYLNTATLDMARDAPEFYVALDQVRISMYTGGGGGVSSSNGSGITADQAIPHIVSKAPLLTLGSVAVSTIDLYGLVTDGYQTPREMLDRANVDQWRYRVNPGRRLDYGPYPTLPDYTITEKASSRLMAPDKVSRVIIGYQNQAGDVQEVIRSVASARQRTETMALGSPAIAEQAGQIADAFMADQAQRKIEGELTVVPGSLLERPSGMPLHPSRLLLAGGDRAYVDEEGEHGRIMGASYTHDTETASVSIGQEPDDRATGMFDQWSMAVGNTSQS